MLSDIEITQQNKMEKIQVIADKCGLTPDDIEQYGHYKAKISFDAIRRLESKPDGKLVLVTAITPTPAGEGKSTTSIGLVQGLQKIGKNAIETAAVLKAGLKEKGYTFYIDSPTNQQFVVLENCKMEELKKDVQFSFWEKADDTHTIVRFATSWATRMEDVEKLLSLL